MTNTFGFLLLIGAFIALAAQGPSAQVTQPVAIRCERGGVVEISQVPVGHRHAVRLAVLGEDTRERFVFLDLNQDDLTPGLSALNKLTGLPVFAEHPDEHLAAAGVPYTTGLYRLPTFSPEQQAQVEDLSPRSAQVTDAGDVVVVYASGRSVLWNPATMAVRTLREGEDRLPGRRCWPGPEVIGIHQRTVVIFLCGGRLEAYDLDSGALRAEVTVAHPHAAALNGADNTLYWLSAGQLHRRSLAENATELPPIPLAERFDRLAFSLRGDILFCARVSYTAGRGASDLYVYKFDQSIVGAAVRVSALKGYDPASMVGIHPQGTRLASLAQRTVPFRPVRDILTFWDLQPAPKKAVEVTEGVPVDMAHPLRYSTDGSTVVGTGRSGTFAIDAATGNVRCAVAARLIFITRLNAHGLSAGIGNGGWQTGDVPRVIVWDSATCQIRSTLNADMELLQSANVAR